MSLVCPPERVLFQHLQKNGKTIVISYFLFTQTITVPNDVSALMAVALCVISKGDHLQQGYLKIVTKYNQDDDDRNHYVDVLLIRMMAMTILVVMMKLTMSAITTLVLNYFN